MSAALPVIPRENNIGMLRLGLAFTVLLYHLYALSLAEPLEWLRSANATLAVHAFFVLSGFLVVMSYENSANADEYFGKRIRRIYPAYATVVLLCAVLGFVFTSGADYFNAAWLRYVAANLAFLNFLTPELPGVFMSNTYTAVNGALWTIKIEVMFYLLVPILVWFLRGKYRLSKIATIYIGSLAFPWFISYNQWPSELLHQLPSQMCYFISGVAFYYYFDWFMAHRLRVCWLALAGIVVTEALINIFSLWFPIMPHFIALLPMPAAVGALVTFVAFSRYLGNVERHGDFSYGIYIWHFPIIQSLVALKLFDTNLTLAVALALTLTALAAYLSWRFVEKPALKRSSHYINATTA